MRGFLRTGLLSFSKRRDCMTLLADLAMVLIRVKGSEEVCVDGGVGVHGFRMLFGY